MRRLATRKILDLVYEKHIIYNIWMLKLSNARIAKKNLQ